MIIQTTQKIWKCIYMFILYLLACPVFVHTGLPLQAINYPIPIQGRRSFLFQHHGNGKLCLVFLKTPTQPPSHWDRKLSQSLTRSSLCRVDSVTLHWARN
jgi:hypothetical protein